MDQTPRELKILDLLSRANLSPAASRMVRELALNHCNVVPKSARGRGSLFYSRKLGGVLAGLSNGENSRLWMLDEESDVVVFFTDIDGIPIENPDGVGGGRFRKHKPDVLVVRKDRAEFELIKETRELKILCEDPETKWLWRRDEVHGWIAPPVSAAASRSDIGTLVVTEQETPRLLVDNHQYLRDYTVKEPSEALLAAYAKVAETVRTNPAVTIGALTSKAGHSHDMDEVLGAIATRHVYVDLRRVSVRDKPNTQVFVDKATAAVFAAAHANTSVTPCLVPPRMSAVAMRMGSRLVHDGVAAEVTWVGRELVRLRICDGPDAGRETELPRTVVQKAVAENDSCVLATLQSEVADLLLLAGAQALLVGAAKARLLGIHCTIDEHALGGPIELPQPSTRAMQLWRASARAGSADHGCELVGLIPKFHKRGNRGDRFSEEVSRLSDTFFSDLLKSEEIKYTTRVEEYEGFIRRMEESRTKGPDGRHMVSHRTFRLLRKRFKEERLLRAEEGNASANQMSTPAERLEHATPIHGTHYGHRVHCDHHKIKLGLICGREGIYLDTAWLTVLIDAYTRKVLAFTVSFAAPSWDSVAAVLRICVQRHGFLPRILVLDNAPEFRGLSILMFQAWSGIHIDYRRTRMPKDGGLIERLFGVTEASIISCLQGSTKLRVKNLFYADEVSPVEHARLSLEAATMILFEYFYELYDRVLIHPALGTTPEQFRLSSLSMDGKRPMAVFDDSTLLRVMSMTTPRTASGLVRIQPRRGIQINGYHYWHPLFGDPRNEGRLVPARIDRNHMDKLFAMVIASDGSGRRVWVVATCARIAEYDFVADVSRKFAEEAARCIALRRTLSAPGNHRAISNFVLRARRLPGSLEELAQVLADDRIRKILLGTDEIAAPGQVAVEDAPPPPDPPKRRGSQSDSPGAIEDVEVGDE